MEKQTLQCKGRKWIRFCFTLLPHAAAVALGHFTRHLACFHWQLGALRVRSTKSERPQSAGHWRTSLPPSLTGPAPSAPARFWGKERARRSDTTQHGPRPPRGLQAPLPARGSGRPPPPRRPGADYEAQLASGPLPPPGRAAARRHNSPPVAAALPPARGGRGAGHRQGPEEPGERGAGRHGGGAWASGAGGFPPEGKVGGERAMARDMATGNRVGLHTGLSGVW